ncbi:mechanosensitive ion channel domain-containing protein [Devosia sp. MC521]|uniref:mechanosensitive ion channel domain-containing protein n=1 Tax=Devosia sp. MC521 TaxID=2759954 RepID=UPI0015FDA241|nr:mechanosensitive ion channel domain-containing protein [Devosia sp. MC521]MBJ6988930.1 mechanosensitive ion channel [Devosia sp. MC521]QMW62277.1 mechanosensitive ion channel [Devosia sp. MC521]
MPFIKVLAVLFFALIPMAAHAQIAPVAAPPAASSAADDLIKILEDDTARAALIEKLKSSAGDAAAEPEAAGPTDLSIARELAEYTRSVAEGASRTIRNLGGAFESVKTLFADGAAASSHQLRDFFINVGMVLVALLVSYWVLRIVVNAITARISAGVAGQSMWKRGGGLIVATLVDLLGIIIAWSLGYVLALNFGTTGSGAMGINQTLLLNAYLVVEVVKLAFRVVLMPRYPALRLLPIADDTAEYWQFWSARMISLVGYTFMFVAPVLRGLVSGAAGDAVEVLVMVTSVVIAIVIVLQNKDDVRLSLEAHARDRENVGFGRLLTVLGRQWHVLVIAYLVALLIVWFSNPDGALPFMVGATVQSLIIIAVATLVATFIGRFVSAGFNLPDDVKTRLPLLETRLRTFVPGVMAVVRWILVAVAVIAIGQAWSLFDFTGWMATDEGLNVVGSIVSALLIVLAAVVIYVVMASWVEYRLNPNVGRAPTSREKTLLNLFKNAFTVVIVVFGAMLALAQIGVNIAPLLAGAGVVGLAIGFGAQKLVQDIITGIFIQFENVMNEGDSVQVAGKSGTVEKLTIRSVTIRDMSGTVHLIPFSAVTDVSNMNRGFSFYVSDVEISTDSDIEQAKQAMRDAFDFVMARPEFAEVILDVLDLQGLIALTPTSVSLRSRIKTLAGKQWGAGRFYSETLMRLFTERGIHTPVQRIKYVSANSSNEPPLLEQHGN